METFQYDFPMNAVMLGSVIPGIRMQVAVSKIATYEDGTNHKLIKTRAQQPDVLADSYPTMHGPHTKGHGFMDKLKGLLAGRSGPQFKEGYEPIAENRDWRLR